MIQIPESEFEMSFVRSSGPGGQNVNKVNSKAVLRWNLEGSGSLSIDQKLRLAEKLSSKLTESGDLIVMSDRFRDQGRNREDCIEKLREMITAALFIPKKRKKTKKTYSSRIRNRESKKIHSEKKRRRSNLGSD